MADAATMQEKYKGAQVVETPQTPEDPVAALRDRYKDAVVANPDVETIADTAEEQLSNEEEYEMGFIPQVGRATWMGLTDYVSAYQVHRELKRRGSDITYKQTLGELRKILDDQQSLGSEIVGSMIPGVGIAKTGANIVKGATKTGMLDGAMRWVAKHPKLGRMAQASAAGAAGGATFEAMQESVDQSIDATTGGEFSAEAVGDAALQGALIGAIGAPIIDAADAGVRRLYRWTKAAFGGSDQQALQATKRLAESVRRPGETPDDAINRLNADINAFREVEGRTPALFEVIPDHQARDIADVSRYYTGLDARARANTEAQVTASIKSMQDAVESMGPRIRDTAEIKRRADDMMDDVARVYGGTEVRVPDDTLEILSANKQWVAQQAKRGNAAARSVLRVVDAQDNVSQLRRSLAERIAKRDNANSAQYLAELNQKIAQMTSDAFNASDVEASQLAQLRNLQQLESAVARLQQRALAAGRAELDVETTLPLLRRAQEVLTDFQENGLKVRYGDASALRSKASREAFATRFSDFDASENAKVLRDALSSVGRDEVPAAGQAVRAYSKAMTRMEAQDVGHRAMASDVSPENLGEFLYQGIKADGGRLPQNLRRTGAAGAAEGARVALRKTARKNPGSVVAAAKNIAEDENLQANIRTVFPKNGNAIIEKMTRLAKTGENAKIIAGTRSPTSLSAELRDAKEAFSATLIGRLGGAAAAGLLTRFMVKAAIPRGTAKKLVDMLSKPGEIDQALKYLQQKRVNLGALTAVLLNSLDGDTD